MQQLWLLSNMWPFVTYDFISAKISHWDYPQLIKQLIFICSSRKIFYGFSVHTTKSSFLHINQLNLLQLQVFCIVFLQYKTRAPRLLLIICIFDGMRISPSSNTIYWLGLGLGFDVFHVKCGYFCKCGYFKICIFYNHKSWQRVNFCKHHLTYTKVILP